MTDAPKKLEFTFERTIPAAAAEVFDAWLDPLVPGTPWNIAERQLLDPRVDGFFYWLVRGTSHYGRFTEMERPARMQYTWVSPNTLGEETTITVTFREAGKNTVMTLVHAGLPDEPKARSHENGWNYFLGLFPDHFKPKAAAPT